MNILIPHTWLLEHLDTQATPEEIQKLVSLSGPSIERIYEIEGESVYDIEVTTNRVDSMSVRGIAREAAVILSEAGVPASLKPLASFEVAPAQSDKPLPKIVNDPTLCKRILCQVVSGIQKKSSPEWMQKRLRQIGVNVHDAVIDTTNYITHDLGHPCHAFDYDKIMKLGGEIYVKEAAPGQHFTIIDGTEYETVGGEVVFTNNAGEIIDLPAIKGTKNTSMSDDTTNVLFWIESIDAKKVRFASMTHAIRTVAAQLNEKNVDPHLADDVFSLGIELFSKFAGGHSASERYDEFPGKKELVAYSFQLSEIERYLGVQIPAGKVISILESLECVVTQEDGALRITPPTFRPDLEIPADIVEEVARIYGYHNLPSILMTGALPTKKQIGVNFDVETDTKLFLATLGGYEVLTYSLISEKTKTAEQLFIGRQKPETHVKLSNALTEDLEYLRRTLWASHLEVLASNPNYKGITVFELANVYIPSADGRESDWENRKMSPSRDRDSNVLPFEEYHLTITSSETERKVKGMLEALCRKYYLPELRYVQEKSETVIYAGDTAVGHFLSLQAHVIDIDWKIFLQLIRKYPVYVPESKFTPVIEDLTFTVPTAHHVGSLLEELRHSMNVATVVLKDIYKRNATFTLSYTSDHQLNADETTEIRSRLIRTALEKCDAKLVGSVA